jgi:signal transduction histidine kinase
MVNNLRKNLLNALECNGEDLISEAIKAIRSTLDCDMCTLWSINHNNTDSGIGEFISASLLFRSLKEGVEYPSHKKEDFVHPLGNSFIEYALDYTSKEKKTHYIGDIYDEHFKKHKSYKTLIKMELSYFICIPIKEGEKKEVNAFIKLAYKNEPLKIIDQIEEIIPIINKAVISAISRYQTYQKQQILDELIKNYSRDKSMLKDVFHPIIHRIFKNYFDYEGSSVFVWNSFDNWYNLLVTTGLEQSPDVAFYEIGEGLTGMAASQEKAKIYDDLIELERRNDPRYLHKYREKTPHKGETLLAVPILSPSNPNKVLGIIRFTNKINKYSKSINKNENYILDYFNDADVDLIKNASHYLALNIENYLGESERKAFISKMSHEFKTPANAIWVTAERVLRKYKLRDTQFMLKDFDHYMQSIIEYSELQMIQVTTNLFMTKAKGINHARYDVGNYPIKSIIKESINIIRPIAREHYVKFDNIEIEHDFPNVMLNVDKDAFKIVFYNLLTNAIKYRDPAHDFRVSLKAQVTSKELIINVLDDGLGVPDGEEEKIFLLGVRSKNVSTINAEGYGIGLHVVRLILGEFDCMIRLSNNQGPTNFEIKIPSTLFVNNN